MDPVKSTWDAAREKCLQRGQSFASLSTVEEWRAVMSVSERGYNENVCYNVGLQRFDKSFPDMYWNMWHWMDGTVALYVNINEENTRFITDSVGTFHFGDLDFHSTNRKWNKCIGYICESPRSDEKSIPYERVDLPRVNADDKMDEILNFFLVKCSERHVTRDFLSCDPQAQCGVGHPAVLCPLHSDRDRMTTGFGKHLTPATPTDIEANPQYVAMFMCDHKRASIAYSLVCDFKAECSDQSDEDFCQHLPCSHKLAHIIGLRCDNGQCFHSIQWCDRVHHCYDRSDEVQWDTLIRKSSGPDLRFSYKRALF